LRSRTSEACVIVLCRREARAGWAIMATAGRGRKDYLKFVQLPIR